jgi:hypothetical protein
MVMDDRELMEEIMKNVRDYDSRTVLVVVLLLRRVLRSARDVSTMRRITKRVVREFPIDKVDMDSMREVIEGVEDGKLKEELTYLMNLMEDLRSRELIDDLDALEKAEELKPDIFLLRILLAFFFFCVYIPYLIVYFPEITTSKNHLFLTVFMSAFLLFAGFIAYASWLLKRIILSEFSQKYNIQLFKEKA